jgi:hypothetical protein
VKTSCEAAVTKTQKSEFYVYLSFLRICRSDSGEVRVSLNRRRLMDIVDER